MGKLGRNVTWSALVAIGLLGVLSVFGAFLGAEKARQFFNSTPLKIYWYLLAILFLAGFTEFPRLLRKPSLLAIHLGCLLVLTGGMLGSDAGHRLAKRFLGIDKIPSGYMVIHEEQSENRIVAEDFKQILGQLPFSIKLKDFRMEYYETDKKSAPRLIIDTQDGQHLQLVAKNGEEISIGQGKNKIKIIGTFENFKIRTENGKKIVADDGRQGENPAAEVRIETPDGNNYTRYVFERYDGFGRGEDGLKLSYISQGPRMIRDYFSDLVVIENNKEVLSKTIEVNHPLHYGGYHFYQHSYDSEKGQYTVLSLTSDSGLYVVYSGYWLLSLGVLWQFWLRPVVGYIKSKKDN
jgi:hypothetical protein